MESTNAPFKVGSSLWMTVGDENFGDRGRIALLAKLAECGSITKAAKAINMSYKAAWDAIDNMNRLAGEPLVERLTGGKGGGGTQLTPRGQKLVDNFNIIALEHGRFMEQLSGQASGIADDFLLIKRMSMKTSARNQYFGKVTQIKQGAVNDEIELEIAGGHKIVAIITHDSTVELGLQVGSEAFALIKSSSIIIMTENENTKFSARNQFAGIISRIISGAVNTDIQIQLPGGSEITSIITNQSCASLKLKVGDKASGIFKASSVILGVPS